MRLIILILFVACPFCNTYSQLEIQGKFRTGDAIQRDGVLLEEDVCIFSLGDGSTRGRWVFQLEGKTEAYELKEQDGYYGTFSFSIKELDIQDLAYYIKGDLKRYVFENDSSVYFKGNIAFQDIAGGMIDCFPIRLNLLPSRPILKNATLECDGFDWDQYQLTNPILNFCFTSSREKKYLINCGEEGRPYIATKFYYPFEKVEVNAGVKTMFFDDMIIGWDDYYILESVNDYGSVVSLDTIRMHKCVDDPELLKEYEKWLELETSVKIQSEDMDAVYYIQSEQALYLQGLLGQKDIKILNFDGAIIRHLQTCDQRIYLPNLKKGIYIVCVTVNKDVITRKFLVN
ncbi:T9SS type A sorting domain-containing protein [Bacteroides salyersiae]|uniref:T9SS type A sorting domain-containing protein n=1 Tax=Bacteroides salyersiae TaxID=291644 RepID=UPI001C8BCE33|nr:T9SS type A sorting domain-containing protein [Bacteroides salyersiae]